MALKEGDTIMDNSILDVFDHRFEYSEMPWGDLIYGTEAQLRALGFTGDFPSLTDRRRQRRTTTDPRGFQCAIDAAWHMGSDVFSVSIPFPGREQPRPAWRDAGLPGIRVMESYRTDDFVGERDALVRAGLVPAGCFPGDPGMRKVTVTIFADGSLPTAAPTANLPSSLTKAPGARTVHLAGAGKFKVTVYCTPEVAAARNEAFWRQREAWEAAMRAMPRPPRLDACLRELRDQTAREQRAQMRVVWSRPAWVPGFNLTM